MDKGVPERYSTPRADIDIVTRAARAPVLLTAYRVDAAGERQQVDFNLQTGVRTRNRETLAQVVQGPFTAVTKDQPADAAVIATAQPNVSFLIHSYALYVRNAAGTAGTSLSIQWNRYDSPAETAEAKIAAVPSVAWALATSGLINALTAPNTSIRVAKSGTLTDWGLTVTYAPVSGVM